MARRVKAWTLRNPCFAINMPPTPPSLSKRRRQPRRLFLPWCRCWWFRRFCSLTSTVCRCRARSSRGLLPIPSFSRHADSASDISADLTGAGATRSLASDFLVRLRSFHAPSFSACCRMGRRIAPFDGGCGAPVTRYGLAVGRRTLGGCACGKCRRPQCHRSGANGEPTARPGASGRRRQPPLHRPGPLQHHTRFHDDEAHRNQPGMAFGRQACRA